jgi:hypothetical protein
MQRAQEAVDRSRNLRHLIWLQRVLRKIRDQGSDGPGGEPPLPH